MFGSEGLSREQGLGGSPEERKATLDEMKKGMEAVPLKEIPKPVDFPVEKNETTMQEQLAAIKAATGEMASEYREDTSPAGSERYAKILASVEKRIEKAKKKQFEKEGMDAELIDSEAEEAARKQMERLTSNPEQLDRFTQTLLATELAEKDAGIRERQRHSEKAGVKSSEVTYQQRLKESPGADPRKLLETHLGYSIGDRHDLLTDVSDSEVDDLLGGLGKKE